MKRLVLIMFVLPLFWACKKTEIKPEQKLTYKEILSKQKEKCGSDTTFLDFVFGSSKAEVNLHVKQLQKDSRLGSWEKKKEMIWTDAYQTISGYVYTFGIKSEDELEEGLVNFYYDDKERLNAISLYIPYHSNNYDLIGFLRERYGQCVYVEDVKDSNEKRYCWLKGQTQIYCRGGFVAFTSVDEAIRIEETKELQDSIVKEELKQKNIQTKKDFK